MRRRYLLSLVGLFIVLAIVLVGVIAGCGSTTTTTTAATITTATEATGSTTTAAIGAEAPVVKEWTIPMLGVQTGPAAGWGLDAIWAAQFAADKINDAGGVRGVPLKLQVFDTAGDPDKSITEMDRVLKMKPLVIHGPTFQTMTDAAGPMAAEEGVLMLAGINIGDNGARLKPWVASLYGNTQRVWEIGVKQYLKVNPDVKSVVLFYVPDNQLWEHNFTEAAFKAAGVNVLASIECTQGQVDFGPTATKAYSLKPDGYYSLLQGPEHSKLMIELKRLGFTQNTLVAVGPGADSAALFESGKGYLDDMYMWDIYYVFNDNPAWKALSDAYQENNNGALPYAPVIAANYDATYAIATALEETGVTGDPAKLKEERTKIRDFIVDAKGLKGVQGDYSYSDGIMISPVYWMQVKDNAPELLEVIPSS